jgi:hypothetical protein
MKQPKAPVRLDFAAHSLADMKRLVVADFLRTSGATRTCVLVFLMAASDRVRSKWS